MPIKPRCEHGFVFGNCYEGWEAGLECGKNMCEHGFYTASGTCYEGWMAGLECGKNMCEHGNYAPRCSLNLNCRQKWLDAKPKRKPKNIGRACEHKKDRSKCRQCGNGTAFCVHNRFKKQCAECDPAGSQRQRLRKAVRLALDRKHKIKSESTLVLMGLSSWEQFEAYWERKIAAWNLLYPEMPIGEVGGDYEVDHVKPVRAFDDDEMAECNHYTNLQPLPRRVNIAKSDTWEWDDERHWRCNIFRQEGNADPYLPIAFNVDAM